MALDVCQCHVTSSGLSFGVPRCLACQWQCSKPRIDPRLSQVSGNSLAESLPSPTSFQSVGKERPSASLNSDVFVQQLTTHQIQQEQGQICPRRKRTFDIYTFPAPILWPRESLHRTFQVVIGKTGAQLLWIASLRLSFQNGAETSGSSCCASREYCPSSTGVVPPFGPEHPTPPLGPFFRRMPPSLHSPYQVQCFVPLPPPRCSELLSINPLPSQEGATPPASAGPRIICRSLPALHTIRKSISCPSLCVLVTPSRQPCTLFHSFRFCNAETASQ